MRQMSLGKEEVSVKAGAMLGRPEKSEVSFFMSVKCLYNAMFMKKKVYCCVPS